MLVKELGNRAELKYSMFYFNSVYLFGFVLFGWKKQPGCFVQLCVYIICLLFQGLLTRVFKVMVGKNQRDVLFVNYVRVRNVFQMHISRFHRL